MKHTPVPPSAVGPITPQQLSTLPPRVAQCISFILAHADDLCGYPTGTLELHYHEHSVTAKHTARWVA